MRVSLHSSAGVMTLNYRTMQANEGNFSTFLGSNNQIFCDLTRDRDVINHTITQWTSCRPDERHLSIFKFVYK